ncbi:hypothetical protein ACH5RR_019891 [Cinchona calisaya]|uniref:Uncharacterized protein n=1 Tax=Cinchona calisaya TaxID=153742 RepID=A0ABD2ZQP3_9GENT
MMEEELKFLQLRTKLNQVIRKQMRNLDDHKAAAVKNDDYGCFFGPWEPAIAPRLLQESTLLLLDQLPNKPPANHSSKCNNHGSIINKAQLLRVMRDYSFLSSDDPAHHVPTTTSSCPQNVVRGVSGSSVPSAAPPVQQVIKESSSLSDHMRRNEGSSFLEPTCSRQRQRCCLLETPEKLASNGRPKGVPLQSLSGTKDKKGAAAHAKTITCSSGPSSAVRPEGVPVPTQVGSKEKNKAAEAAKTACNPSSRSMINNSRAENTKLRSPPPAVAAVSKKSTAGKRECRSLLYSAGNPNQKRPRPLNGSQLLSKKAPQPKEQQIRRNSARPGTSQQRHPKRNKPTSIARNHVTTRRRRHLKEEEEESAGAISSIIRNMFGYDPTKYHDHDNYDPCMEVAFQDIQREECRSAKIAKKEDQEELIKIVAEQSRHRLEKEAAPKKRKLAHS